MTDHDTPSDNIQPEHTPTENTPSGNSPSPVDTEVDRRLNETFRAAVTGAPKADRRAFVAAARNRRDRARRHRRAWLITTPIAAAILLVVVIGVVVSNSNGSSTTQKATVAQSWGVYNEHVRITPDHGLTDGQTVQVTVRGARAVGFSQCAIVQSPDGRTFYACAQDPSTVPDSVIGNVPAGSNTDDWVARGRFTVSEELHGRLHLLTYPDPHSTNLVTEPSVVSCAQGPTPTVTPVPEDTSTDTMAPTTSNGPRGTTGRPSDNGRSTPAVSRCVIMASGMFSDITIGVPTAPIFFGTDQPSPRSEPSSTDGAQTAEANNETASFHTKWADVRVTPSGGSLEAQIRTAGAEEFGPRQDIAPNPSDAWVTTPIGLTDATIHIIALAPGAEVTDVYGSEGVAEFVKKCGKFECDVFAVPRDRTGPPITLRVAFKGRTSTLKLDPVPADGSGVLKFHTNG